MYYYILEPQGKKGQVWQERVKDLLGNMGIAGETVTPGTARTVDELVSLGLAKGYSTIVAVGSETLVNKVVNHLVNQKENPNVVLGVIPENYDSVMAKMLKVHDLHSACETLKFRKFVTRDACLIEPNKYFLTEGVIATAKPADAYLITPEIKAGMVFNQIIIRPGLMIEVVDESPIQTPKKFLGWLFGQKIHSNGQSFFHPKSARIEVIPQGVPLKVDGEVLTRTPLIIKNAPRALKIIVSRDTINEKKD